MKELKPCPFCGGKARVFRLGVKASYTEWGCVCVDCGAIPWASIISNVNDIEYVRECIARKWNEYVREYIARK